MDMQSTDRWRLGKPGRKTTIVAVLAVSMLLVLPLAINQSNAYGKDAVWQVGLSQNFN